MYLPSFAVNLGFASLHTVVWYSMIGFIVTCYSFLNPQHHMRFFRDRKAQDKVKRWELKGSDLQGEEVPDRWWSMSERTNFSLLWRVRRRGIEKSTVTGWGMATMKSGRQSFLKNFENPKGNWSAAQHLSNTLNSVSVKCSWTENYYSNKALPSSQLWIFCKAHLLHWAFGSSPSALLRHTAYLTYTWMCCYFIGKKWAHI